MAAGRCITAPSSSASSIIAAIACANSRRSADLWITLTGYPQPHRPMSSVRSVTYVAGCSGVRGPLVTRLILLQRVQIGDDVRPVLRFGKAGECHLGTFGEGLWIMEPVVELLRVPFFVLVFLQCGGELVARDTGD